MTSNQHSATSTTSWKLFGFPITENGEIIAPSDHRVVVSDTMISEGRHRRHDHHHHHHRHHDHHNLDHQDHHHHHHQLLEDRKFKCQFCRRVFANSQALGGHQNAHKRERQRVSAQFQQAPLPRPPARGPVLIPQAEASSANHAAAAATKRSLLVPAAALNYVNNPAASSVVQPVLGRPCASTLRFHNNNYNNNNNNSQQYCTLVSRPVLGQFGHIIATSATTSDLRQLGKPDQVGVDLHLKLSLSG